MKPARSAKPRRDGIGVRRPQRRLADVGADADGLRQFGQQRQQDRAGAGADVGDAKRRSAMVRRAIFPAPASTTVSVSGRGTSVAARQLQRQSPEFLDARECARPVRRRDAGAQMPRDASLHPGRPVGCRDQAGQIEAERRADQHPRVEFGGSMPDSNRAVSMRRALRRCPAKIRHARLAQSHHRRPCESRGPYAAPRDKAVVDTLATRAPRYGSLLRRDDRPSRCPQGRSRRAPWAASCAA